MNTLLYRHCDAGDFFCRHCGKENKFLPQQSVRIPEMPINQTIQFKLQYAELNCGLIAWEREKETVGRDGLVFI